MSASATSRSCSTSSEVRTDPARPYDPLRFCIFTTIALLAWALGPAVAVVLMSGAGLVAYGYAWRAGLRQTRCFLRDPRLAMGYLGVALIAGCVSLVWG